MACKTFGLTLPEVGLARGMPCPKVAGRRGYEAGR